MNTNKIAIVTGANTGLGYWNTLDLSQEGYKVIMACRSIDKGNDAKQKILEVNPQADIEVMSIDLSSVASVRAFAKEFESKYKTLDLLVNNAGIMLVPYSQTEDGFESTMAANYFGHFLLTGLLLGTLKKASGSRVVSLSSISHKRGSINLDDINSKNTFSSTAAYSQSKLACLMFAYELERRLQKAGINILSVASHPGLSDTDLARYMPIPKILLDGLRVTIGKLIFQSAEAGSKPTLLAATGKDVKGGDYYGPNGMGELKGKPVKVTSTSLSHDEDLAKKLWEKSEELVGFKYSF